MRRTLTIPALFQPISARFLVLLFLLALAFRILNLLTLSGDEKMFQIGDSGGYLREAAAWIARGTFAGYLNGEIVLPMERMPGYLWVLAGIRAAFGGTPVAIAAVQSVADAGTCVLIALLAARVHEDFGRIAGVCAAVWPNLIIHANLVLQDTLFLFFFAAWMLAVARFADTPRLRLALMAGFLFGGALMVRSVIQFGVPLAVLLVIFLAARGRAGAVGVAAAPVVFLLAVLVPLTPVLYRNITNFGTMALTTQTGLHALFWTTTLVRMDEKGTDFDTEVKVIQAKFEARLKARGIEKTQLNPFEVDALRQDMATEELLATPVWRLAKVWTQGAVITLFSPAVLFDKRVRSLPRPSFYATAGTNLPERIWRYFFDDPGWFQCIIGLALLVGLGMAIIQFVGLWQMLRGWPLATLGIAILVFYFLAVSGPTAGPKYRMPFEPVMVLLFSIGVAWLLGWRRPPTGVAR